MQSRITTHIRSTVGSLTIFLVLSGTASAAVAPQNSVVSSSIKDGEVKNPDLGTKAVTAPKVATDTLTGGQIKESTLDFTVLQKRLAGLCPIGKAIRLIRQDGSVACQQVPGGTVKSVGTGTGLSGGPITRSGTIQLAAPFRLPQACSNGQLAKWNGTNWVCADSGGTGWGLTGNAGTTSSNFLGTTDNQPLNLRVNAARALRLEPASDGTNQSPNVIGGIADNAVTSGAHSGTIGGGGRSDPADAATANRVTDDQGTIGGGANNQAGDGAGTVSDRPGATVGGGAGNTASGEHATVGGGTFNTASGSRSTVAGGQFISAGGNSATVAGGSSNSAAGDRSFVAGGNANLASGQGSAVGGGEGNHANGDWATVPGGNQSTAQGDLSLAAGLGAQANDDGSFVWADSNPFFFPSTAQNQFNVRSTGGVRLVSSINVAGSPTSGLELPPGGSGWSTLVNGQPFDVKVNGTRGLRIEPATDCCGNQRPNVIGGNGDNSVTSGAAAATIGGGGPLPAGPSTANRVTDSYGTVSGGGNNRAGDAAGTATDQVAATVSGGLSNVASAQYTTVAGGLTNNATVGAATVSGGTNNTASEQYATVPGGYFNTAHGQYSFAAGKGARAQHDGSFVWGDSSSVGFLDSTAPNQFIARATGHFFLQSDDSLDDQGGFINTSTGAYLSTGGTWTNSSDKHLKAGFERVDPRRILRRVNSMPVRSWHYKAEPSVRHIGPVAQDFYRAFQVGPDNKHIASVDADGVALAAIKGLSRKVERLQRKVAALEKQGSR